MRRAMATGPTLAAVVPMELAKRGAVMRVQLPLESLPRVSAHVLGGESIEVDISFARDEQGRCRVRGAVESVLSLQCQSCLEPVARRVHTDIDLCVVASEREADEMDPDLNPFVLDGGEATLATLVEDDVLLSLPVRVCERGDTCPSRPTLDYPAPNVSEAPRANPFAALKARDSGTD